MSSPKIVLNVAAKAVIARGDGKVLILRESARHDTNTRVGRYQLPGGRLEIGEPLFDGLKREVLEETGLAVEIGEPLLAGEWRPVVKAVPHQIIGMFFACTTKANDARISEEHDDALWIDPKDYKQYDIVEPDWQAAEAYVSRYHQSE